MSICILRAYFSFADAVLSFFGVTLMFPLFCYGSFSYFCFHRIRGPSPNSSSICLHLDSHTQLPSNCLCPLFLCFFFVFLEISLFPGFFFRSFSCPFVWKVHCTFSFPTMFSYLVTTSWISTPAYHVLQYF